MKKNYTDSRPPSSVLFTAGQINDMNFYSSVLDSFRKSIVKNNQYTTKENYIQAKNALLNLIEIFEDIQQ